MPCTEAYKEHIEYTFNAFCRVVIHYAAINAWRDRDKRRQREISFEYLTEEKFYPFCTSDTYFIWFCLWWKKKSYGVSVAKMKNCEERLRKLFIKSAIQRNGNRIFR